MKEEIPPMRRWHIRQVRVSDVCLSQWAKSKKIKHQCSSTDSYVGIGYLVNCTFSN